MITALTPRQHRFTHAIASGMTQLEAYRSAGYSIRNRRAAENNASRLMKNEGVKQRLAEIRSKSEHKTTLTLLAKRQWLARMVLGEEPEATIGDRLKAADLDSRLAGHYQPEQRDHKFKVVIGEESLIQQIRQE